MKKIVAILSLAVAIVAINLSAMEVEPAAQGMVIDYGAMGNEQLEELARLQAEGHPISPALRQHISEIQQHLGQNMKLQRELAQKVRAVDRCNAQRNERRAGRQRLNFDVID